MAVLSAVLRQALVRGDAEADKELCARAMGAVYSAHAAAIGALPSHRLVCCSVRQTDKQTIISCKGFLVEPVCPRLRCL